MSNGRAPGQAVEDQRQRDRDKFEREMEAWRAEAGYLVRLGKAEAAARGNEASADTQVVPDRELEPGA